HDPNTWICPLGRCVPLMSGRYVGAIKEYLCLPLFALFGTRAAMVRLVSMLMGGLGIWGLAKLIRDQVNERVAIAVAFALAINPAYTAMNVFDNGTVGVWMAAFGILCLALSRYVRHEDTGSAFWLGVATGLGIWARANFVWLIGAVLVAAALAVGRGMVRPRGHVLWWIAGGVVGGLPFLAYQIHSRGGTWEASGRFPAKGTLAESVFERVVMLSETLLTDREHRVMWDGPMMPDWQRWFFPLIVVASAALLLRQKQWSRGITLAFVLLAAMFFGARLQVAEHHLIALLPLAVTMV